MALQQNTDAGWIYYYQCQWNGYYQYRRTEKALRSLKGESIQLEGMYPGYEGVYRYPLNLDDE